MKKMYFFVIFLTFLLFCNGALFAQLVGGSGFLQGQWLEVGVDNMGALGTCTSPPGYHVHGAPGAACFTAGDGLDACYDWGHDGWGVGTPCEMGDYTEPGTPQEGWGMEYNGVEYRNWADGYLVGIFTDAECMGPFDITGSLTGYTNAGGSTACVWAGAAAGLNVIQETRVDTEASWVVVTTKMYNTTGTPITNVFYERTCDPDNTSYWTGGTSATENVIVHQNEDAAHRVEVGTYGTTGIYNRYNSWMSLATKDCRARCYVIQNVTASMFSDLYPVTGVTEAYIWAGSAGFTQALGDSDNEDVGIVLLFNIGTINGGDSAAVSYAYVYDGPTGIDSAFPDPVLEVDNDSILPSVPVPNPVYDTFDVCGLVGYDSLDINILHGAVRNWTWSHWTWAPSTGLTSTTGTLDTIITTVLPPSITYTITGTDSSGTGVMENCQTRVFYLTIMTCNLCTNNSPCQGDTLYLKRKGDSTGCTYRWVGPPASGFTSTLQDPFIYPSTLSDAGEYYVYRTLLGVTDTDSTNVVIHPTPVVTASSNSPLCTAPLGTLTLFATPAPPMGGETYSWTGPDGFSSALQDPTIPLFGPPNTGIYKVVTTTPFGCTDSANTDAELIPPPPAPVITGVSLYCQGMPFVPFVVTDSFGVVLDSDILWYNAATGGVGTTTPPTGTTVNTFIPGVYTVWASRKIGECEGPRGSFSVRVVTTPAAPLVTGLMQYCQYIGPYVPVTVHLAPATGVANWYTAATGGTAAPTEPTPNINVSGVYTDYVSQTDTGCEGPRTPVTITVHPKPSPPVVHPQPICQFQTPGPESATPFGSGDNLLWYGPGVTVGTGTAPTPSTLTAPDTIDYYVTETTVYGCVSDSALDVQIVIHKPAPPKTNPVSYCQGAVAQPLNAQVDSAANSYLDWYTGGTLLPGAPLPPTSDSTPAGNTTWYVAQTVNTCESDSASVTVTVLYTPVFSINATQPYVCQYDSISLSYNGPELVAPSYTWALPVGASFASGTHVYDDSIAVNFDSATVNNYVTLTVSDDSGACKTTESIRINIISQPTAQAYTQPDVCLGDTVALALATRASDAYSYIWYIDYIQMLNSQSATIITSNSNSGGPFSISWVDSGRHVIEVQTFSSDGCRSAPSFDTVNVHAAPNADFKITSKTQTGCIDDTVQFTADVADYNNSYHWSPAASFENVNTPAAWGKILYANTTITLTVTDPFGCVATQSMELNPNSCCTVWFPNAFTPNGDGKNDYFRPVYNGYHHFHEFEIMNRWGQVLFTAENNNLQWDGNFNGVPQDMGTYFYYLKYDCGGETIEAKGDVTLIR